MGILVSSSPSTHKKSQTPFTPLRTLTSLTRLHFGRRINIFEYYYTMIMIYYYCWVRTPLLDAMVPARRGSVSVATRKARANALNVASMM